MMFHAVLSQRGLNQRQIAQAGGARPTAVALAGAAQQSDSDDWCFSSLRLLLMSSWLPLGLWRSVAYGVSCCLVSAGLESASGRYGGKHQNGSSGAHRNSAAVMVGASLLSSLQ